MFVRLSAHNSCKRSSLYPLFEAMPFLQPFDTLELSMCNITSVSTADIMDAAFFNFFEQDNRACTLNQHINIHTLALKQFHAPAFESFFQTLVNFWYAKPDSKSRLLIQRYSTDGPMRVKDENSVYAYQNIKTFLLVLSNVLEQEIDLTVV
jgi:hypothetical protein